MEITTDIALRGSAWDVAIEELAPLFKPRAQYSIYMLSLSIGIMYDQKILSEEDYRHSVPRNVIQNNDNGKLDFMFQTAILSTTTENFTEDQRLELAFGEKTDFKKIDFLTQFANFGVTKLVDQIGSSPLESMENIKNFLSSIVEGNNFDIDALPDDILLGEDI
jgi:hypothetical protein